MSAFVKNHLSTILKLFIAVLLAWVGFVAVIIWQSGSSETRDALASGKRFIIHVEDGRVEGAVTMVEAKSEEKGDVPPPAAEPTPADASAVTAVQASSSPIAEVSEDMVDRSSGVSLPKISAADVKPWQYYIKTFRRQNELPLIAIIITGLGQSKKVTEMALGLDDRISLSFSPYGATVGSWAAASRLTGHEMYVDLPLQTINYPSKDPGPYSMLITRSNTENIKNLYWTMSRFQGYAGLVAPMDEVVTANADTFIPLAKEIERRGVMLLIGHVVTQPLEMEENSRSNKLELVTNTADVWIDEELTEMSMQARLATLEQIAQRNGYAVGIAQAYPLSINQIKHWQETLGERGAALAPVSAITKLKN